MHSRTWVHVLFQNWSVITWQFDWRWMFKVKRSTLPVNSYALACTSVFENRTISRCELSNRTLPWPLSMRSAFEETSMASYTTKGQVNFVGIHVRTRSGNIEATAKLGRLSHHHSCLWNFEVWIRYHPSYRSLMPTDRSNVELHDTSVANDENHFSGCI